ncbi:nucleotide disphospho-sugar-binding domain-containing protein [Streptomyces sp. NPDC057680]|uniref:nucleotide disphospho-sugar-binding domain-containing protein n=1 Tax=Streptomyces sp. NPDC057680 TaxID=3346208 RepID=UPI00368FC50E
MRVLFTLFPGAAHLYPVVPLARALLAAGHEVRVASHPELTGAVTAAGLAAVEIGDRVDVPALVGACASDDRLDRITGALDIADGDPGNRRNVIRYYMLAGFSLYHPAPPAAGTAGDPARGSATDDLVAFARSWKPDLVLWDPLSFAAPIAARAAGAAHARLLWGIDYFGWMRSAENRRRAAALPGGDPVASAMRPELERHGLEFDEELLLGQWSVDLMPTGMRITDEVRYQPVRRIPYTGGGAVPEWLHGPAERPRVVLTLGVSTRKMFAEEAGFPISELLEMVAGRDIELVATLDRDQLASVRSIPENVRTIDYVPLDQLLPTSSAIVHHGSVGTFGIAAAHRVPQLIVPVEGGDGVVVARYLEDRGAGLSMGTGGFTAPELWKNLERLLGEASFQTAADALHADSLASPSPLEAVPALEALTAHHRAGRR